MRTNQLLVLAAFSATLVASSHAALFLNDDFATFNSGDLVGQNGWTQLGTTASSLPLQVSAGSVVIPAGQTADNQDALKNFTTPFLPPASGTSSLFIGVQLNLSYAPAANSSYFLAAYDATGGFANIRVAAKDSGTGGFLLGGRVTGQAGYPFAFGTVALSYNTVHNVIIEADLVAGAQNDVMKIFVDPTSTDLASLTPYATSTYTTGTGTDPTQLTAFLISQYASATTTNVGALIGKVVAGDTYSEVLTVVPEPSSLAVFGVGAVIIAFLRRRQY